MKAALGKAPAIKVFGTDYPTPDGTAIRDYIHVLDLADAHIKALEYLEREQSSNIFNLGTGTGSSVKQVIDATKQVSGIDFPVEYAPRRPGDPVAIWADNSKARDESSGGSRSTGWTRLSTVPGAGIAPIPRLRQIGGPRTEQIVAIRSPVHPLRRRCPQRPTVRRLRLRHRPRRGWCYATARRTSDRRSGKAAAARRLCPSRHTDRGPAAAVGGPARHATPVAPVARLVAPARRLLPRKSRSTCGRLFDRRVLLEADRYDCCMAVDYRHAGNIGAES